MKTKKKLELKNGYANDDLCGLCGACWVFCVLNLTAHWNWSSTYASYAEEY